MCGPLLDRWCAVAAPVIVGPVGVAIVEVLRFPAESAPHRRAVMSNAVAPGIRFLFIGVPGRLRGKT
jgi:hypothetical protein